MEISSSEKTDLEPELIRNLIGVYGLVNVSEGEFIEYIRSKMTTFFNIENWMNNIPKKILLLEHVFMVA
jgi:hypothetical protein